MESADDHESLDETTPTTNSFDDGGWTDLHYAALDGIYYFELVYEFKKFSELVF